MDVNVNVNTEGGCVGKWQSYKRL